MSAIGKCPHCGAQVLNKARKCHACGQQLRDESGNRVVPAGPDGEAKRALDQELLAALQGKQLDVEPRDYQQQLAIAFFAAYVLPVIAVIGGLLVIALAFNLHWILGVVLAASVFAAVTGPLMSWGHARERRRILTTENEPRLYGFVQLLCDALGTPMPDRILVNCDVNAAAARRRGDLELYLGMPLVCGLNVSQLGGVIAHELGHFTQAASMGATTRLRRLGAWHQIALEHPEIVTSWTFLHPLYRIYFRVMQNLLGIACGRMMQEMEFDADRYEIALSGTPTFAQTTRLIHALGRAQSVYEKVEQMERDGVLPNNLPLLVVKEAVQLKDDQWQEIDQAIQATETSALDTHPADRERIAQANDLAMPGALHATQSATLLFSDFDGLSERVTLDVYRNVYGKDFRQDEMTPVEETEAKLAEDKAMEEALGEYFRGELDPACPLPVASGHVAAPDDLKACVKRWRDYARVATAQREEYTRLLAAWREANDKVEKADAGIALHNANLTSRGRGADGVTLRSLTTRLEKLTQKRDDLREQMRAYGDAAAAQLMHALQLAVADPICKRMADGVEKRREIARLAPLLRSLISLNASRLTLGGHLCGIVALCEAHEHLRNDDDYRLFFRALQKSCTATFECVERLRMATGRIDFPFKSSRNFRTVDHYLVNYGRGSSQPLPDEGPVALLNWATGVRERYDRLMIRTLGRLAVIARETEATVRELLARRG